MGNDYLLFSSDNGCKYIYDTPTNSIHPLANHIDINIIDQIYNSNDLSLVNLFSKESNVDLVFLSYIDSWRNKTKAFRSNNIKTKKLYFRNLEEVPLYKKGITWISDLVITTTNECNLRCDYCVFSSNYTDYRDHQKNKMTKEISRKSIDWFFLYNDNNLFRSYRERNLNILFYGGEPFLNFNVIKDSILYAKENQRQHYGLVFSISTNITLLKKDYLPFLKKHEVFLNISLDGPPQEHNRYRRYRNKKNTYDSVMSKLNLIKEFDEEYYYNKVKILPTINGNSDVIAVYDFFEANDLPPFLMVNFLKDLYTSTFHSKFPFDINLFQNKLDNLKAKYLKDKKNKKKFKRGDFLFHLFEEQLQHIYNRIQTYGETSYDWYTGTCLPGRKICVYPDGNFHICERVNGFFPIGNVDNGLNEKKIIELLNKYFATTPECSKCWARNLCNICFATVCYSDTFKFDLHCNSMKAFLAESLSLFCTVFEIQNTPFDLM